MCSRQNDIGSPTTCTDSPRRRASPATARPYGPAPMTSSSIARPILAAMAESATPVLVAGARTPIGRFRGALREYSGVELGAAAVNAALQRAEGLEPDYVVLGNVLQAANGQNPGRRAALAGGIRRNVPGITV